MFDSPLITFDSLALTVSMVICALAAYRALTSRRVLAAPLYRQRALWTGSVAAMTIPFDAWAIYLENTGSSVALGLVPPNGTPEFYLYVILTAAFAGVAFAWIDSTIRVAMELDFVHRDVVSWMKLRPIAGVALVAGVVVAQFEATPLELFTAAVLLAGSAVYFAAALVAGVSRVHDETMRRYMRWMGFVVASIPLYLVTISLNPYLNFPLAIFAYFLYGMTTSLLKTAPLSAATTGVPASGGQPVALQDQGPM
jgi:hypothetical protein